MLIMTANKERYQPGRVRDAIYQVLGSTVKPLSVKQIEDAVTRIIGPAPPSSVRSYLALNTPDLFIRESRGFYMLRDNRSIEPFQESEGDRIWLEPVKVGQSTIFHSDCFEWIKQQDETSIHAVITDPPYGLYEYSAEQQAKLRNGKGGVWRIPPSFDGHQRSPLPRFTTLTSHQLEEIRSFFFSWARLLLSKLVPGAHVIVASNPLVSFIVAGSLADSGLERRGEIIRLTMTMRGGDRPKDAHTEFAEISVMPRSMWEPWIVFRKPTEGRIQDNLRKWKTGGFRRPYKNKPFGDVIVSAPTRKSERLLAPHPSLKPQAFLRQLVRAVLPLGEGVILDPFAGAGSTLAAAEAIGYTSIGIEKDEYYFRIACEAIPKLVNYNGNGKL